MSRKKVWNLIKRSKGFNVRFYRSLEVWIILTMTLNVLLSLVIFYSYLQRPESDFYATYGETPPIALAPMSHPNYGSVPLLTDYVAQDSAVRTGPPE